MEQWKNDVVVEDTGSVTARVDDGFFVRQNDGYAKVCYGDILWVEADNNYSDIHLRGGRVVCVIFSLTALMKRLPPGRFLRGAPLVCGECVRGGPDCGEHAVHRSAQGGREPPLPQAGVSGFRLSGGTEQGCMKKKQLSITEDCLYCQPCRSVRTGFSISF